MRYHLKVLKFKRNQNSRIDFVLEKMKAIVKVFLIIKIYFLKVIIEGGWREMVRKKMRERVRWV